MIWYATVEWMPWYDMVCYGRGCHCMIWNATMESSASLLRYGVVRYILDWNGMVFMYVYAGIKCNDGMVLVCMKWNGMEC